jgi:Ethanolamine utilization protein EutJ (predicted chaperonin)
MVERVLGMVVVAGCCALAIVLLLNRYTAPSCGAEITTAKLVSEVSTKTGLSGLYLLDPQEVSGGLLSLTRRCVVDVAPITGLQSLGAAHWLRVIYSARIDRPTGAVTVRSRVAGPVSPVFQTSPAT